MEQFQLYCDCHDGRSTFVLYQGKKFQDAECYLVFHLDDQFAYANRAALEPQPYETASMYLHRNAGMNHS